MTALVDQLYDEVQATGGGRRDTSNLIARLQRRTRWSVSETDKVMHKRSPGPVGNYARLNGESRVEPWFDAPVSTPSAPANEGSVWRLLPERSRQHRGLGFVRPLDFEGLACGRGAVRAIGSAAWVS